MKSANRWLRVLTAVMGVGIVGGAWVFSEDIVLDRLPQMVIETLKSKFPKAELVKAEQINELGQSVYKVHLAAKKSSMIARVAMNGGLLEVEKTITAKELPDIVFEAIKAKYPDPKIEFAQEVTTVRYEVTVRNADGEDVELSIDPSGMIDEEH